MDTREGAHRAEHDDHAAWWAALSPEERYHAIEMVRLDQDSLYLAGDRPTGDRAEFVRRQPEYLERFAGADNIARQDDIGLGLEAVPDAHADTAPLTDTDDGKPRDVRER